MRWHVEHHRREPPAEVVATRRRVGSRPPAHEGRPAIGAFPAALIAPSLIGLQTAAGNRAVQRLLGVGSHMLRLSAHRPPAAQIVVQRWKEYTTEFAEDLADRGRIRVFDDRIGHILERHGPEGTARGPTFHQFLTDKPATVKSYILTALKSGRVVKSPGNAFDFEYTFDQVIGRDTAGEEAKTIRVVVVEVGKAGDQGKVQTAYPVP